MRKVSLCFAICMFLFAVVCTLPAVSWAQTATTGTVIGTVSDPSGAAVADAAVVLRNRATNNQATQTTNGAGQYTFVNVAPGEYEVTVKKEGFRSSTVTSLNVDVTKSYTVDVRLDLGQVTESVTVLTEARVELQTTDAQVGDVIGGTTLSRLPTLTRDASELLTLQPGTTPYDTPANGGFGNNGGTVAGARSDQNSITLDGIDITDNTVGGGATAQNFIPTGVESLEEFRVGVSNSNIDFSRSSGGNITLVSKSGGNTIHGDGYWFHQSDGYNANSWDLNHTPDGNGNAFTRKSAFKDNREGVSVGGPIIKDKTFFFSNYEVRRFPSQEQVSHIVPTDNLRNGILSFKDASGVVRQYNLATSTACGPNGNLLCDPRGVGISPTIQTLYKLNPAGNNSSLPGVDGNNTTGFVANAAAPIKDDYVTFRLDHNFTDKMHFFGRYIYSRALALSNNNPQIDTLGGKTAVTSGNDVRGDGAIGALDYAFNSFTSNNIRFGWIRSRVFLPGVSPSASAATLALAGTNTSAGFVALAPGLAATGLIDVPIDVDTQRARTQGNFQRNKQLVDNFTHIKGSHTITAGGDVRWLPLIAQRNDKVVGSLASLVATEDADVFGTSQTIPAINRPPSCSITLTTFCLQPTDVLRWDRLYAATLGIVDNVNVLAVRDGSLAPQPFGTPLIANTNQQAYDFYAQDTWRIRPGLTITYGLGYGWQTPPTEAHRQQTFEINNGNGQILTAAGYIQQKEQAAAAGQIFNPTIGYLPIKDSGRSGIWNTDYGDIAPRLSVAWSPSYTDGKRGKLFGAGKTVIRAGFGIYYDRINNVQSVEIPQLGVGFAQTLVLPTPPCNLNTGATGPECNAALGASNIGASGFRVGVDGDLPVPPVPAVSSPIVPALGGENLSFAVDPNFKVGRSYSIDFNLQRELPGNMLMEIGYIGRIARDLPNSVDFDSSPYNFLDKASGQTFAQAFDNVAHELATGKAVTDQPWFNNQLAGLTGPGCTSPTTCLANEAASAFIGQSVGNVFGQIDADRAALGMPTFNNHQINFALFMRTHNDLSNYHAATISLRKRPSHGLQFDMNYTFSKSLDQVGTVQNNAGTYASSFNPNFQYGPSLFDHTHIFNAIFNYDLPAGEGHKFGFQNSFINKIIGGWYVSGVFRAASGPPLTVSDGDLGGGFFGNVTNAIPLTGTSQLGAGLHGSVCSGTNGFGSNGDGPSCSGAPQGTGLNLFGNPDAAAAAFRAVNIATDGRDGTGNPLRGLGLWNFDSRLGKSTSFHERFKVEFSADFFNLFNHVNFFQPSLNLQNPATFGVISQELIPADRTQGSRWIQLGLRVSF
ncbi:MAG TPA: carboxypeptidase-like regulatory domain-containing protein [Candidatus Acidoferrum sp.]|nr:carboxypeptidase-like regulatory domain-containing protein [Candidatus Acidoferrum sp.]